MGQKSSRTRVLSRSSAPSSPPKQAPRHASEQQTATSDVKQLLQAQHFAQAITIAERVLREHQRKFGEEHPSTLASAFELGLAFHGDGRIAKACQVFEILLPISEVVLGTNHIDTITTLVALAEELCNLGRLDACLEQLVDARQRYEESLGPQSEQTICALVDIAQLCKVLGYEDDASTNFILALDRSERSLGSQHEITLAIHNDLRESHIGLSLEDTVEILRQSGLRVPNESFRSSRSTTSLQLMSAPNSRVLSSAGYEAFNALCLRLGPRDGEQTPQPPVFIPPYYDDRDDYSDHHDSGNQSDSGNQHDRDDQHDTGDPSFRALINRSIAILPLTRASNTDPSAIDQLIRTHVEFLRTLTCLDELLVSEKNPVWFFQLVDSFMEQTTFQCWDPSSLDNYVVLPMDGRLLNPEDFVFVSHYWRTQEDPDPDGIDLRGLQDLIKNGFWQKSKYFWVDWTCLPQLERTSSQRKYFSTALTSIQKLIRCCSFLANFTEFNPRLWVLFEVASFILSRPGPVGLPCADQFRKHLRQMEGTGVREMMLNFGYKCTNGGDREWVISWIEMLLILRDTVPCIESRNQILDAMDNPNVRTCTHAESGVHIDKERGIIHASGTIYRITPRAVVDSTSGVSEVHIASNFELRLNKALRRASRSFDDSGLGEIAREIDSGGDFRVGEVIHRQFLAADNTLASREGLVINLEQQRRYTEAKEQCSHDLDEGGDGTKERFVALRQQELLFALYKRWKDEPLEKVIPFRFSDGPSQAEQSYQQSTARNGQERSWLQNLDQRLWKYENPARLKSLEERGLRLQKEGHHSDALRLHWQFLGQRKASLGPYHRDTRRSLRIVANGFRLVGLGEVAELSYTILLSVCDFTLGTFHYESRLVLCDRATMAAAQNKHGLARSYYRQHLERIMAVDHWHSKEGDVARMFLKAAITNVFLEATHSDLSMRAQIRIKACDTRPDFGTEGHGQQTQSSGNGNIVRFINNELDDTWADIFTLIW